MTTHLNYPCPFNMFLFDAEFNPDFVIQDTQVWFIFNFLGLTSPISSTSCVFAPYTQFNCNISTIIPKPKKNGPAFLYTTVVYFANDKKQICPIGRSRVNVETLIADWTTRNTFSVPLMADQTKTLCKLHFICSLVPPTLQIDSDNFSYHYHNESSPYQQQQIPEITQEKVEQIKNIYKLQLPVQNQSQHIQQVPYIPKIQDYNPLISQNIDQTNNSQQENINEDNPYSTLIEQSNPYEELDEDIPIITKTDNSLHKRKGTPEELNPYANL